MRALIQLWTNIHKSRNKSVFCSDQLFVACWMEHSKMSEWATEPNAGNKADVSQDCQCQICHRNHIAKRQGELTHEIVHNTSIIAICRRIDCENVAASVKPLFLHWSLELGRWTTLCSSGVKWVLVRKCFTVTHVGLILQKILHFYV